LKPGHCVRRDRCDGEFIIKHTKLVKSSVYEGDEGDEGKRGDNWTDDNDDNDDDDDDDDDDDENNDDENNDDDNDDDSDEATYIASNRNDNAEEREHPNEFLRCNTFFDDRDYCTVCLYSWLTPRLPIILQKFSRHSCLVNNTNKN
jgi:hypothetical protein